MDSVYRHVTSRKDPSKNEETTNEACNNNDACRMNRRTFVKMAGVTAGAIAFGAGLSRLVGPVYGAVPPAPLDPRTITKYADPLPVPGVLKGTSLTVTMSQFTQQLLPSGFPKTPVWGYNGTYPGPTIEATKGTPINVTYMNNLPKTHLFASAIDHTLDNLQNLPDVRNVVHLHGGEVASVDDGNPLDWFVPGKSKSVNYPNGQQATTLWYHDHALAITRLNVNTGLAGFYLLRDPAVETAFNLPSGPYEIPLVIQDRSFFTDGSLNYLNDVPPNPTVHPQWIPEFFGDTILANGKVWPFLNVEPRKYRFRILNGSNARFYELSLVDKITNVPGPVFNQIGTDGGYLAAPVPLTSIFIAPAERADVVIDFSGLAVGTKLLLKNSSKAPFPKGTAPDPQTVGQIMEFRVVSLTAPDTSTLPTTLFPVNKLDPAKATVKRQLTLNEVQGPGGPLMVLLNNTTFDSAVTEMPKVGSTEIWEIINISADTHPIHVHLIQFQLLSRQMFNVTQYTSTYNAAFPGGAYKGGGGPPLPYNTPNAAGALGGNPDVTPFLQNGAIPPAPSEAGWKDTIKMNPGEVTRIIARFARQDGTPFSFDPTLGKGYVWHCHILEHEDNDMMRPYKLVKK